MRTPFTKPKLSTLFHYSVLFSDWSNSARHHPDGDHKRNIKRVRINRNAVAFKVVQMNSGYFAIDVTSKEIIGKPISKLPISEVCSDYTQ